MRILLTVSIGICLLASPAHGLDWAGKVQQDIRDLSSPSVKVRLRALSRLRQYRGREVQPLTLKALRDDDPQVRRMAANLAGERKIRQAVPILLGWLSHWDTEIRLAAAVSLGQIGDPRGVKSLVRALVDPEIKVRLGVIKALGQLSSQNRLEVVPLLGRLQDTNAKVRRAAVEVLAAKRDPRAVIPLMGRMEDSAREVRIAAIVALGELGDAKAGPALVRLLRDPSFDVAAAAVKTLGKLRYAGGTEPLIDLFKSGTTAHRGRAARALAALGTNLAISALMSGLGDPRLRASAKAALVQVGPLAAPQLTELLRDPRVQRTVAVAAVEVARDAKLKAAVPLVVEQIRLSKLPVLLLIQTLGAIGDPRAQRPLLDLMDHPNLEVRMATLKALEGIIDERAAEPLVRLLDDNHRLLRLKVIDYLGRMGSRLATPRLIALARDHDRVLARAAVGALSRSRDRRAWPTLVGLLSHRDRSLRQLSAQALARIRAPGSVGQILELCEDSLGSVRVACLQAIGGVLRGKTHDQAFRFLGKMVHGKDRSVFLAAMDALAAMRDRRIPALLLRRYPELDPKLQRKIVEIIGNDPDCSSTTRPFLLKILDHEDPYLRSAAAWSLGKLRDSRAVPRLVTAARDPSWLVRTNAVASIARLRRRGTLSLLRLSLSDPVAYVRANAVLGIGLLGDRSPAIVSMLTRKLFKERNPWVRLNALRSLRRVQPRRTPLRSADGRRWDNIDQLTRAVAREDLDTRVRRVADRLLAPRSAPEGSWVGLHLLDHGRRSLRNTLVVLITPSGLVRAAISDGRAELWEENLSDGHCYSELPPPTLTARASEN